MKKKEEQIIGYDRLEFFGTVTASLSHEIMNVFAVINEYGGLLEDISYAVAKDSGSSKLTKRLGPLGNKLVTQVNRGQELLQRLNRFSHSVDNPSRGFSLTIVGSEIVNLTRRLEDMKRVELIENFSADDFEITGDPFAFQQMIFLALKIILNSVTESAIANINYQSESDGFKIEIKCDITLDNSELTRDVRQLMKETSEYVGAKVKEATDGFEFYFQQI